MGGESPIGRIERVDALRGYALMGLFLVHMVEYYELYWASPKPSPIFDAIFILFAGKTFSLLALCFGFSFWVVMEGAARKGTDFSLRFAWRLLLLAGIGWLHSLVYRGDIGRDVSLLATVPRDSLSHTVRVGVVLSVPLVTALPPRERTQPARERN